jgi:hypothetical protein
MLAEDERDGSHATGEVPSERGSHRAIFFQHDRHRTSQLWYEVRRGQQVAHRSAWILIASSGPRRMMPIYASAVFPPYVSNRYATMASLSPIFTPVFGSSR